MLRSQIQIHEFTSAVRNCSKVLTCPFPLCMPYQCAGKFGEKQTELVARYESCMWERTVVDRNRKEGKHTTINRSLLPKMSFISLRQEPILKP